MPELPEVETLARDLDDSLRDAVVSAVQVLWPRALACPSMGQLEAGLPGRQVTGVGRRGKFLVISLSGPSYVLVHLRMSGSLRLEPDNGSLDAYARAVLHLCDGRRLVFSDMRKFGRIWWVPDPQPVLAGLGREPLDASLTVDELGHILSGRRGALKPLLLNQRVLAGLGNIYADEALFVAGLHPLRQAGALTPTEVNRLHAAIRQVLQEAIHNRGTTLADERFLDAEGHPGHNREHLRVYRRTGQTCLRCSGRVKRIVVGGRGTHYCPSCQMAC